MVQTLHTPILLSMHLQMATVCTWIQLDYGTPLHVIQLSRLLFAVLHIHRL